MYVTTFYSFKGGVGRSMALANAVVELAQRGRRVLAVDFDLEAPGLDTFDVLRPPDEVPGVIDFVREYLESGNAPDARRFLAQLPDVGDKGGELWIMPSGAQRTTYAAHFNQIDWAELYEKRDGYLLFEDLKAQWQQAVNPDYVLIDSRTGHTDSGGICTRQLPDAVTILFFPNEQNLRGLTRVVNDIRAETEEPRRKKIELHFVMSNVPDLDDEDRILEKKIQAFCNQLGLETDPLIVHRYDSLSLLNQMVFTRDRPKSRLAKEYCAVVDELVGRNLYDRDGALDYIERTARAWGHGRETYESPRTLDEKLRRIEQVHSEDGEVLFALGEFRASDPRVEPSASLFDRAIKAGYDQPEVYLRRARIRARNNDPNGASEDVLCALQTERVTPRLIWEAVLLAEGLERPEELTISISILQRILGDASVPEEGRAPARTALAMRFIATGACSEAAKLLRYGDRGIEGMNIRDAFNYGMAVWGASGEIVPEPFARAVAVDRSESEPAPGPNYLQCMAIACWAIGETAAAAEFETRARAVVRSPVFSCWRYTEVPINEFNEDLDDIRALIDGDSSRVPRFMPSRALET